MTGRPAVGRLLHCDPVKSRPSIRPPEDRTREIEGYEPDFCAWTQRTPGMLRGGRFEEDDIEHVAEEIEDTGRRDVRELNSRVQVLMVHLTQSPSLRPTLATPAHSASSSSWNRAIAAGGHPGSDPAAVAFRRRTRGIVRGSRRW